MIQVTPQMRILVAVEPADPFDYAQGRFFARGSMD